MKLYLIHAGFYDRKVSGGFYESHTNYFVAADTKTEAKKKAKELENKFLPQVEDIIIAIEEVCYI